MNGPKYGVHNGYIGFTAQLSVTWWIFNWTAWCEELSKVEAHSKFSNTISSVTINKNIVGSVACW